MIAGILIFLAQATQSTQPASRPASQPAAVAAEEIRRLLTQLDLSETFTQTTWTGWAILLVGLFVGVAGGKLVQGVLRALGDRVKKRGWALRGTAILSLAEPAYMAVFATGLSMGLAPIALSQNLRDYFAYPIIKLLYIIAAAWALWGLIELIDLILRQLVSKTGSKLDDQIVPLIRKTLRLFLLIVFVLFTANTVFKANITAWLAGFGVAGLAVSLAAQDSLKNLFGSLTIFLDRPFAVGERVRVDRYEGLIEEIGYRSSRLRTLEGSLVTIPNSKIVDNYVENLGRPDRIRRELNVKMPPDTPAEKVEQATEIIKRVLNQEQIAADLDSGELAPKVTFNHFDDGGLNIRVTYWFKSSDPGAYPAHGEKVNLALLRALNEAGIQRK
jgi:MscS family membrane protein